MKSSRVPGSEWRKLSEAEQLRVIRDSAVPDWRTLDPELRKIVLDMADNSEAQTRIA